MKKETKELVDWIKKQINLAKECCIKPCHENGYKEYDEDYEKAMTFLDSLPQIEERLCFGGYIQDKNGTPCCDGMLVKFLRKSDMEIKPTYGDLIWDKNMARFVIEVCNDKGYKLIISETEWFEKVQ